MFPSFNTTIRGALLMVESRCAMMSVVRPFINCCSACMSRCSVSASSALDAETEQRLMQALQQLMKGRTTLIIAHRLSTISNAPRIVVLKDGNIVESGSHDGLLALRRL